MSELVVSAMFEDCHDSRNGTTAGMSGRSVFLTYCVALVHVDHH